MSNYTIDQLHIASGTNLLNTARGDVMSYIKSSFANDQRDLSCRFYHNTGGGSFASYVAKRIFKKGIVEPVNEVLRNEFRNAFKDDTEAEKSSEAQELDDHFKKEVEQFGSIKVGKNVVYAFDDWGTITTDAIMLKIDVENDVRIKQKAPYSILITKGKDENGVYINDFTCKSIVWYDTTALVSINSDKNLIITQVQGRDYSRKELVSNGDIKFSVSGQITSREAEVYPAEEVEKFIKIMQYKGVVQVQHQVLSRFGITHMVITDFSLSPKEGYKSMQQYSFSAVGLQPESEITIKEDSLIFDTETVVNIDTTTEKNWKDMLIDAGMEVGGALAGTAVNYFEGKYLDDLDSVLDTI